MRRWFLAASISIALAAPLAAAQSIAPEVFRALQSSQAAQQAGNLAQAEQALQAVKPKDKSLEQALVWRSQAYVFWAQGKNTAAITVLTQAFNSGQLTDEQLTEDRLNLAKLNFAAKNYQQALTYLQKSVQSSEVLEMQIQAWQGLGRLDQALPLAERYLKGKNPIDDNWLQFMVGANAELKRYAEAQRWQKRILQRSPDSLNAWKQLAALQQMANQHAKALATLRTAYTKGINFKQSDLDSLITLASASDQPWQAARLLEGMLKSGLMSSSPTTQERLAQLHWQARDYKNASKQYSQLAQQSGKGQHWLNLAQLEIQQGHWNAGLQALAAAEKSGADQQQVRLWRDWAQSRIELEQQTKRIVNK